MDIANYVLLLMVNIPISIFMFFSSDKIWI